MGFGGLLSKIFGGPASDLIKSVGGVIDNLTTSDKEKLDAKLALVKIEQEFNLAVLTADGATVREQAAVIKAEIASESWMARNWRPILMLTFTFIVAYNYVFAPMFSMTTLPIPQDMWQLLKLGIGGYVIGRSVEKVSSDVLPAIIAAKK